MSSGEVDDALGAAGVALQFLVGVHANHLSGLCVVEVGLDPARAALVCTAYRLDGVLRDGFIPHAAMRDVCHFERLGSWRRHVEQEEIDDDGRVVGNVDRLFVNYHIMAQRLCAAQVENYVVEHAMPFFARLPDTSAAAPLFVAHELAVL